MKVDFSIGHFGYVMAKCKPVILNVLFPAFFPLLDVDELDETTEMGLSDSVSEMGLE